MLDIKRELERFLDAIFVIIPPLPENQELYHRVLGESLNRHQDLVIEGMDPLKALEIVMEEITAHKALNEAIPLEEGRLWTRIETRANTRKTQIIRYASLIMFILGALVFAFGLILGRDVPVYVWLIITGLLWILPVFLLMAQRTIYGEIDQADNEPK